MHTMEPPDLKTAGTVIDKQLQRMLGDRYAEMDPHELLVVVVLPETKNLYEAVKRWSEATTGILTLTRNPNANPNPNPNPNPNQATTGIPTQCAKALKIQGDGGRAKPLGTSSQYHAGTRATLKLLACSLTSLPAFTSLLACQLTGLPAD